MRADETVRAVGTLCTSWLADVLFPLALRAAALPPATTAAEILARREPRIPCYDMEAVDRCEGLTIVATAIFVAYMADDEGARIARDAIVHLAKEAAYEFAIAMDLIADVPAGCGIPSDFVAREEAADEACARWTALDGPVAEEMMLLVRSLADTVGEL
jgi:hypothetical protein